MTRKIDCPNCGSKSTPKEVVRGAEKIVYYCCTNCDFSTWDRKEFNAS